MSKVSFTGPMATGDNMYHGKHYAFFHHPEMMTSEPLMYKNLVASATRSVEIWDPYFNDTDTELFSYLQNNTKVKVLLCTTKPLFLSKAPSMWKLSSNIQLTGKSGVQIMFGCVDKGNNTYKVWEWHDRWLIIDDERVFLIGSSLAYYLKPINTTGIYELKSEEDKELVKEMFKKYWKAALEGCKLKAEVIV